ncbi:MAG: polyphosphate polymerase domain-containing protein [Bacteroidales bacterium]|nr:polyphosphate polymerase domain-containing protein [Bacteroidales bacterium]
MRYEFKYIVPENKLDQLRRMIIPFLDVDQFAEVEGYNQYTVRSIYFDSPRYDFYFEKIEGIKNRKKVRLRGYNECQPENIVFLEIKRKYDVPIIKYRAPVKFEDAMEMFHEKNINGQILSDILPQGTENSKRFFYQIFSKTLRPVILVVYDREAYLSKFDKTVRITLDKNLRGKPYPAIDDLYEENGLTRSLSGSLIMEVKFNKIFPGWMNPVISSLGLKRQSASKYVITMDTNRVVKQFTKTTVLTRSRWN